MIFGFQLLGLKHSEGTSDRLREHPIGLVCS